MTLRKLLLAAPVVLLRSSRSLALSAQGKGVAPADLLKPLADVVADLLR